MILIRRVLALLALTVIVVIATRQLGWDPGALHDRLRDASWSLLALAVVANVASIGTRAWLWWLFLRSAGAPAFSLALRGTIVGLALNGVLIARVGEPARVLTVMKGSAIDGASAVATVLAERAAMIAGYIVLAVVASELIELPDALVRTLHLSLAAILVVVALVSGGVALDRFRSQPAHDGIDPSPRRRVVGSARVVARARSIAAIVRATPIHRCALLVAATWVLQLATYHLTALALGFPTPLSGSVVALVIVNASATPGITPGNAGVMQLAYVASMRISGLPPNEAVDVAVVLQLIQTLPVLLLWPVLMVAGWCRPVRVARSRHDVVRNDGRGAFDVVASILGCRAAPSPYGGCRSLRGWFAAGTSLCKASVTSLSDAHLTRRSALRREPSRARRS